MRAAEIITFGCRLNAFESEVMRGHAAADTVIVNTCAVTAEAERQARQAIRGARRRRPDARIVVTGCAAQIDPGRYAAMPEVDRVLGNAEKLEADCLAPGPRVRVNDIMALRDTAPPLIGGFDGRSRAFIEVQNGCDHRCTFCIIPFGRGPNRGVPAERVIAQARTLAAAGYGEMVLTGVDICSYDAAGVGLGRLAARLLAEVPELARLRLSSLDPARIDGHLLRLVAEEPRLMPHLHLSVQAGDDMILKRMRRRHGRGDIIALAARLRDLRPGIALGADMIAGFPTESAAMFANSLDLVDAAGLAFLHVFPFSPRAGTPAARMPQIAAAERKARAARLRDAGRAAHRRLLDRLVGTTARVLIEKDNRGRSEHYAPLRLAPPAAAAAGKIITARVVARDGDGLIGASPA